MDLWQAQNIWNDLLQHGNTSEADQSVSETEAWADEFRRLGLALNIAVDRLVVEEGVAIS